MYVFDFPAASGCSCCLQPVKFDQLPLTESAVVPLKVRARCVNHRCPVFEKEFDYTVQIREVEPV